MKKLMIACLVVLMSAGFAYADALTIDVSGSDGMWVLSATEVQGSGSVPVAMAAMALDRAPAGISNNGTFDFSGVAFTGVGSGQLNIELFGYSGDKIKYDQRIFVTPGSPLLSFNFLGIDKLVFDVYNGNRYVYDGSGFRAANGGAASAPVPEPSTMLLLGTGLLGLVGFRKRFRK